MKSTLVGRYELLEPLGEGGMAIVFRARDPELERSVAIKLLKSEGSPAAERERFLREARIAGQLRHPNIITVFDVFEHEDRLCIAMERIHGTTLRRTLDATAVPLQEKLRLLAQVADGLEAAHQQGIVHRDLKPDNVLVTEQGEARVGDWGLSRSVEDPTGLTRTGVILGTPQYLAPERLTRGQSLPAGDLYALGCMVFEAIRGRPPFDHPVLLDLLDAHVREVPAHLDEASGDLGDLVDQLLEKDPERRPPSARGVATRLRSAAEEAGGGRRRTTGMPTVRTELTSPLLAPGPATMATPAVARRMPSRSARWTTGALLVAALAGLLVRQRFGQPSVEELLREAEACIRDGRHAAALTGLEAAVEQGSLPARVRLAGILLAGQDGVAADPDRAMRLYSEAAAGNDPEAMTRLGVLYIQGRGVPVDHGTAFRFFSDASGRSHPEALRWMGHFSQFGLIGPANPEQAVGYYERAAQAGDPGAWTGLGSCYLEGTGVARDPGRAFECFREAADRGHAPGLVNLGSCYENGSGVQPDPAAAFRCYDEAARHGELIAMLKLGDCYLEGEGVPADAARAVRIFGDVLTRQPATAAAWMRLGTCHRLGRGTSIDLAQAYTCYLAGAKLGDPDCQYWTGRALAAGTGVAQDPIRAFDWFRKSADHGGSRAVYEVMRCYEQGLGVPQDLEEASRWRTKLSGKELRNLMLEDFATR